MPSLSATTLVQRLTARVSTYRWPLVITATLVMTAVFSLSPLVDVGHPEPGLAASLRTPIAYDLAAPASNVLDALTLLSPAQYWATFGLCAAIFIALWSYRRIRSRVPFAIAPLVRAALGFVGGAIAIVGIMLVPSRPMASLALGGIFQGRALNDPNKSFLDALHIGLVFFRVSTLGDLLMLAGNGLLALNLAVWLVRCCRACCVPAIVAAVKPQLAEVAR